MYIYYYISYVMNCVYLHACICTLYIHIHKYMHTSHNVSMCIYLTALQVLKKHYHSLWRSFPEDYMSSLTTVCAEYKVSDEIIELITSYPTADQCNQELLNFLVFITRTDDNVMAFCNLIGKLITNPKLSRIVSALRKGTSTTVQLVCTQVQ